MVDRARTLLAGFARDGQYAYSGHGIDILYFPFHTTEESRIQSQPYVSSSGTVFVWDGRLDNASELAGHLGQSRSAGGSDVQLVAAAYERWGPNSLPKLIGDWALAVWTPADRALLLATDFLGTRHIYFSVQSDVATWSSLLDPLVLLAQKEFRINEEYLAGSIGSFPAANLTPYEGIHRVPPGSAVRINRATSTIRRYWEFNPGKTIRYQSDSEYEEHFRTVLRQSIARRLKSDSPVLAELSGGIDSSSIVCLADQLIARGCAEATRLDTVSFYDDSEPNWNERPFFSIVEKWRGQVGLHIAAAPAANGAIRPLDRRFASTPSAPFSESLASSQLQGYMSSGGHRVVLSGLGGDEVLGGVPNPIPELADLLGELCFLDFARQTAAWSLAIRKPILVLLRELAAHFFPVLCRNLSSIPTDFPWLKAEFRRRNRAALAGYPRSYRFSGSLPSFQENLITLDALRRQLASVCLPRHPMNEKRYPYLDRDFLEFVYAIPRRQLIRPGQRRSLMRRALAGLVPADILERKRKAFVVRGLVTVLSNSFPAVARNPREGGTSSLGFIDLETIRQLVEEARAGQQVPFLHLLRTLRVAGWYRHLLALGLVYDSSTTLGQGRDRSAEAVEFT